MKAVSIPYWLEGKAVRITMKDKTTATGVLHRRYAATSESHGGMRRNGEYVFWLTHAAVMLPNSPGPRTVPKFDFTEEKLVAIEKAAPLGTRLIKLACPGCRYVIRTARKWLSKGVPTCPCGKKFQPSDSEPLQLSLKRKLK